MKKRITVASAVVTAAAAFTSALLARRAQFFAQAPQRNETFTTSAGPVELPVRYSDGSLMGAFWLVEETKAAALLPDNLEPLLLPGRNAAAGLFMMDYRNSTLGPYGEVGIGIQAVRKGTGATLIGYLWDMVANVFHVDEMLSLFGQEDSGLYVVTLPVTTQVSVAGGREVWGFPKYLAEMQSDFSDPKRASFALEGEFEASLAQGFTVPTPGLPFLTYTEQPTADITRTKIRVGHTFRWGGTLELDVHGDGPTAAAIKKLGLDASPALAVFRTDGVQADLPAGKQLPFLYSTKDIPTPPPSIVSDKYVFEGFTAPTPPAEETSYELDPALIQLVGVLCLVGGCLGLVVYAILSIDE